MSSVGVTAPTHSWYLCDTLTWNVLYVTWNVNLKQSYKTHIGQLNDNLPNIAVLNTNRSLVFTYKITKLNASLIRQLRFWAIEIRTLYSYSACIIIAQDPLVTATVNSINPHIKPNGWSVSALLEERYLLRKLAQCGFRCSKL